MDKLFMKKVKLVPNTNTCYHEVRFNDLWFVFDDSSWSFIEPYVSRKYIFHESYEWTEHRIMVLKPANKYQIIWWCPNFENILINDFRQHSISLLSTSFSDIIFTEANIINILQKQTIKHSNIYLLFDLLGHQKIIL